MSTYHKRQLEKLKDNEIYNKSVKFWDGLGQHTNQLDLTLESIPVLIEFLKNESKRLKKISKIKLK